MLDTINEYVKENLGLIIVGAAIGWGILGAINLVDESMKSLKEEA